MIYKRQILYNNKLELWETLIKFHIVCHKIHLSEQLIKTLAYILELGLEKAEIELVEENILTVQEFKNYKTKLKAKNILVKESHNNWLVSSPYKSWKLNREFTTLINCKVNANT